MIAPSSFWARRRTGRRRRPSVALLLAVPVLAIPLRAQPAAADLQFSDQIEVGIRENNEPDVVDFRFVIPQIGLGLTPGAIALKEANGQVSDVLKFTATESTIMGPQTLLDLSIQSVDGATVPDGAAELSETGGFQNLDGQFRDAGGNVIRIPFGIDFASDTSEAATASEGVLLSIPHSFESAVSNSSFFGNFTVPAGQQSGAVVLDEPASEEAPGTVSDVITYISNTTLGSGVIFTSDNDRSPLARPPGATTVDETGHLQDITSKFTDVDGSSVTLPFDLSVESDLVPEPSTFVLLSTSLCVLGIGRVRRAILCWAGRAR